MTSSTSHSNPPIRKPGRLAALLVATGLVAFALGAIYTLYFNPELRVMVAGAHIKQAWAAELTQKYTNKIIVFGGSSSNFSIDPEHALSARGEPVANMGLYAAIGAPLLARFALDAARPGDTLIASIEPRLLFEPETERRTGAQFAFAMGRPDWAPFHSDFSKKDIPYTAVSWLPPSGEHVIVLVARLLRHQPLYRYKGENFTKAGQQFDPTPPRFSEPVLPGKVTGDFLQNLKEECDRRGLRLAYLLPWQYLPAEKADEIRQKNAVFLKEIAKTIPVLEEPALGVYTNLNGAGDYLFHLNRIGAKERTDSFIEALKKQRTVWNAGQK